MSQRIARDTHAIFRRLGGVRRHRGRGPSGRSLGRRALPPPRRGPRRRARAGNGVPASARRRARRDGRRAARRPRPEWTVRYALMLGLERVLSEKPPHLASGTELRRHQVDALAGMLTELIAAVEKHENGNGNGNANGARRRARSSRRTTRTRTTLPVERRRATRADEPAAAPAQDPGAERRYRFRHPTASGKTIAAAGLRRGRAHRGRPDPHAPPPARRPVPARADRPRLRRPLHRRRSSAARRRASRTRSRSRPTPGSRGTSTRSRAPRTSS